MRTQNSRRNARWLIASAAAAVLLAIFALSYLYLLPQSYIQALQTTSKDTEVAYQAHDHLIGRSRRAQADELLAQFFERRNDRDSAIMIRARAGDLAGLSELIGTDYNALQSTFRYPGPIHTVAFSPSRELVAIGVWHNTARLFVPSTGHEIVRTPTGPSPQPVLDLAFTPDGELLATGALDGTARVSQPSAGRELARFAIARVVSSVTFSPDGKLIAVGSGERVQLFDIHTKREILVVNGLISVVAFSPDRKLLTLVSRDLRGKETTWVLDLTTRRQRTSFPSNSLITNVGFSADSKLLAVASYDGVVRLIALDTGRELRRLSQPAAIDAVRFDPYRKLIATGSDDNTARVFQLSSGREVARISCQETVAKVTFSPDGKQVAVACLDGAVRVFQVFTDREPPPRAEPGSVSEDRPYQLLPGEIARLLPELRMRRATYYAYSPGKNLLVTQTGNWLHLYRRSQNQWIPVANRHLPALWDGTLGFLPADAHCPHCVEVDRDVPENARKTEIVNFDAPRSHRPRHPATARR